MIRALVIGAGGMLGSALVTALGEAGIARHDPGFRFDWSYPAKIAVQFRQAIQGLLDGLVADDRFEIYWAAGVGTMGATSEMLSAEKASLALLLSALEEALPACQASGTIGFASSAGALYANCRDFLVTERSEVTVSTDYARAKFSEEAMLQEFISLQPKISLMIARISTLYGPGQATGKRQGLLSHLARSALQQKPVEIFVPLDTARDYLLASDAAHAFVASMRLVREKGHRSLIRILAAEQSVTISEIIATFNRLLKKRMRIISTRNTLSALYQTRISYRSLVPLPEAYAVRRHSLIEGASILLYAERKNFAAKTVGR